MSDNVINFSQALKDTERSALGRVPMPFVKWAGGKRAIIRHLAPFFPDEIGNYWEPFVGGGGGAFFTFSDRIERAHLSDTNEELVIAYKMVQQDVEGLIGKLQEHRKRHFARMGKKYADGKTYYQRVREQAPDDPLDVAARFIYLNKTCYNGLYRVNKSGGFNVPEGNYKNPDICNPDRLRKASKALKRAKITLGDFDRASPGRGDMVYCDPPYDGCFTNYQANGFDDEEQVRLQAAAKAWRKAGASVILSNADTKAMRKLYKDWTIHKATAVRCIGQQVASRTRAAELIITK